MTLVVAVMKSILAAIPLVFVLSVAACGGNKPVNKKAENADGLDQVVAQANATADAAATIVSTSSERVPPAPLGSRKVRASSGSAGAHAGFTAQTPIV